MVCFVINVYLIMRYCSFQIMYSETFVPSQKFPKMTFRILIVYIFLSFQFIFNKNQSDSKF